VTLNQNTDDLKYFVFQIYVLPPIDKIPESHPHAEKISRLVAEEKSKLKDVRDVLRKTDLATRCIQPEVLASQHSGVTGRKSVRTKHLIAKENVSAYKELTPGADSIMDMACSPVMDLGPGGTSQHPENLSLNTQVQDKGLEEQQQMSELKAGGNFAPLDGGVSRSLNSIVKIQTCSQCHRLLCRETRKEGSSEDVKAICEKCTGNSMTSESSTTEKVVTLYRCGICCVDFFEKDALATHMDENHKVSAETVFDTVTKNSSHTAATSQRQGPSLSANMEMLCPPENLLLQNIVLQLRPPVETLPLTFTSPNILMNPAPLFTLHPSNVPGVLTSPQTSTVAAPKNLMSAPKLLLQSSAEVLADTGRVLVLEKAVQPVPKVAIPKLNSMNKATSDSSAPPDDSPVQKVEVRNSNNESPK